MAEEKSYLIPNEAQRINEVELKRILKYCADNESSDVTLQTNEPIYAEIHGKLYRITNRRLSNPEVGALLNVMYGPNGTTQLLSGKDLDHYFEVRPSRIERIRFRINATACLVEGHTGIQITLRIIPSTPPDMSDMHLPEVLLENLTPEQGIIYITGATGSGKSTLLASIIKLIAEDPECHRKILTYESPIEFVYDSVVKHSALISQSEIPVHLPSFAAGVRNALRRKPRLILVGESRDQETIAASLEAALTGHPVYTTLHSNGVAETIRRLVGTFPREERNGRTLDIIETVRMIIWQKLVPTVDGKRVALREHLIFNDEIRDTLMDVDPTTVTSETRKLLEKHGKTMAQDAEEKFNEGQISEDTFKLLTARTKKQALDAHTQTE
jgi:defect in organelle trafficking protein DotB